MRLHIYSLDASTVACHGHCHAWQATGGSRDLRHAHLPRGWEPARADAKAAAAQTPILCLFCLSGHSSSTPGHADERTGRIHPYASARLFTRGHREAPVTHCKDEWVSVQVL